MVTQRTPRRRAESVYTTPTVDPGHGPVAGPDQVNSLGSPAASHDPPNALGRVRVTGFIPLGLGAGADLHQAVVRDEHVLGLEVAMHDAAILSRGEADHNLPCVGP